MIHDDRYMRKELDVNAHRTQFKEHARSNGAHIRVPRLLAPAETQPFQPSPFWWEKFLPRRETRLMSEEASRTSGVFLPYPLLGILMSLILALGGGIIGMYVKLDTMNATMIMRDGDHREAVKKLENQNELQELLIRDLREKQVEMRSDVNQLLKRRGGS